MSPAPRQKLPARQLSDVIDRMIERADAPGKLFAGHAWVSNCSRGPVIRERLGISSRVHYGWRSGEKPRVSFDVADQVLTLAGLCWWDVWNEDTVRLPILTVSRHWPRTRVHSGRLVCQRRSERTYGDAGPDMATLAEVRAMWEPALEAVA